MANAVPVPTPTEEELRRFWNKVRKQPGDGCWIWIGALNNGYGAFTFRGLLRRAHRLAYVWEHGELGVEYTGLDHICNERRCVRPSHLRPALAIENVLRGSGPTAQNARKEQSVSGSELDYVDPRGWRGSRADRAAASARYLDAHRDEINAKRRANRKRVVHEPRVCALEGCEEVFVPKRSDKRYHSEHCQATANNRKQYKKRRGL
jgi:hypothetical protein